MSSVKTDYLIIGQGIAGSMLAYHLMAEGKNVLLIDKGHEGASSSVAAGILNPVTGKLLVKSWRIDDLLPKAISTYRELEKLLSTPLLHLRSIIRRMHNVKEENQWYLRMGQEEYLTYLKKPSIQADLKEKLNLNGLCGEITGGGHVDLGILISIYRKHLIIENLLLPENFDYAQLTFTDDRIEYKHISAKAIIFCEGDRGRINPFFEFLPFDVVKGEILLAHIPNADFEHIFKLGRLFIVPTPQKDIYWIGSTYEWKKLDYATTKEKQEELENQLRESLRIPYEIIDRRAAIRPAIKDRRPLIGRHPELPNLYIFNGMGTKGASLSPFWAEHFTNHLCHGTALDPSVDLSRFS